MFSSLAVGAGWLGSVAAYLSFSTRFAGLRFHYHSEKVVGLDTETTIFQLKQVISVHI